LKIYISQGSAAMQLSSGYICSNQFITNFPQNMTMGKFWNRSTFGEVMGQKIYGFWPTPHVHIIKTRPTSL